MKKYQHIVHGTLRITQLQAILIKYLTVDTNALSLFHVIHPEHSLQGTYRVAAAVLNKFGYKDISNKESPEFREAFQTIYMKYKKRIDDISMFGTEADTETCES
jgi:hypothetical protein